MSNRNRNNNTTNTTNNNISPETSLLVTILNTMYNDNLRQMYSLQDSNIEIRRTIINLLSNLRETNINANNNIENINVNRNISNISNINNLDYYNNLYSQYQNIPLNNTRTTNNTSRLVAGNPSEIARSRNPARTSREPANYIRNRSAPRISPNLTNYLQNFFDPIEIFPTQTQIENATRIVLYRDIVTPTNQSCPISLEPFHDEDTVSVIRFCGHTFHRNELIQWFRSNSRCPVCRYDIRNYIASNNPDNNANSNNNENSNINQNNNLEETNESEEDEEDEEDEIPEPTTQQPPVPIQQTNTTNQRTILDSLTDTILNGYYMNNTNNTNLNNMYYETIFLDIIFDSSYNYDVSYNIPNNQNNQYNQ